MAVDGYPVVINTDGTFSVTNTVGAVPTTLELYNESYEGATSGFFNVPSYTFFLTTTGSNKGWLGCIAGGTPTTPASAVATMRPTPSLSNTVAQFIYAPSLGIARIYIANSVPAVYYVVAHVTFSPSSTTAPVILTLGPTTNSGMVTFYSP